jgi:peptide/nickel transport system permease protein
LSNATAPITPGRGRPVLRRTTRGNTASARERSAVADLWWRYARSRLATLALFVLIAIVLMAIFAPMLAPYDPTEQFRREGLGPQGQPLPPNEKFLLGTDARGRDVLSRIMWGARVSLLIGFAASLISVGIAVVVGGIAGTRGGRVDQIMMRFVDLIMSVPTFFVTLLLLTLVRPSPWVVILVIALFSWTYPSRIFRSEVLSLRQRDFVAASRSLGAPESMIFTRHVLPHLLPLIIVYCALSIPGVIFAESALSYLGLGVPPPTPAWGTMIQEGQAYYRAAPWLILFPGAALMITVVCLNLVSNQLREVLDPSQRK